MKTIITLIFCTLGFSLFAQYDRPNDFYISKHGDTVYGKIFVGLKNISFTFPSGEKIKLHPDSVLSYAYYAGNVSVPASEGNNYYTTVLSLESKFFVIYYKGNGPVKILYEDGLNIAGGLTTLTPVEDDFYYFERNGVLTIFHATHFYTAALKYMVDCPDMAEYLDHVPTQKKGNKTHRAKFSDATSVLDKYNQCISGK